MRINDYDADQVGQSQLENGEIGLICAVRFIEGSISNKEDQMYVNRMKGIVHTHHSCKLY